MPVGRRFSRDERSTESRSIAAAEAVDRLRRIREHAAAPARCAMRRGDATLRFPRADQNGTATAASRAHSASDEERFGAREIASSVTFIARSLPRTTTTGRPSRSHSAASSVAVTRARRAPATCACSITSRGNPCGVCARQSALAIDRAHDRPGVVDFLERVDDRQRGDRAVSAARLGDHAIDRRVARRAGAPRRGRARRCASSGRSSSPFAHRLAARRVRRWRPAAGRCRTGTAMVADRRRSACGSTHTTIATSRRAPWNVCTLCSSIGLPADPAELLELLAARRACRFPPATMTTPTSRTVRTSLMRRALEQARLIVRTPTARSAAGTRFGTPRSARYAVVMPIFAASASRRSACDTGRISPPSPTSPMNTASCGSARS